MMKQQNSQHDESCCLENSTCSQRVRLAGPNLGAPLVQMDHLAENKDRPKRGWNLAQQPHAPSLGNSRNPGQCDKIKTYKNMNISSQPQQFCICSSQHPRGLVQEIQKLRRHVGGSASESFGRWWSTQSLWWEACRYPTVSHSVQRISKRIMSDMSFVSLRHSWTKVAQP